MHYRNHAQGYGLVLIVLHWFMAMVIVGLFALGLWMTDLTYYDSWYRKAPHIHKSMGILLALAWIVRVVWRMTNVKPKPIQSIPKSERIIATAVHWLLYLLMAAVIMSGYLISTADGRPIDVFTWFSVPAWITSIDNQEDLAGKIHFYLACSLVGLASLHALAALKHHFYDKDATLVRMLNPNHTDDNEAMK